MTGVLKIQRFLGQGSKEDNEVLCKFPPGIFISQDQKQILWIELIHEFRIKKNA